jgi:hypothetical protein
MKKLIAIGMATMLLLVLMIGIGPVQAAEPPPDTPGAWIIYPDSTPDHWVGNDRYSEVWGDLYTSIHEALGYSGNLVYPGPANDDIGYWDGSYDPPPEGSIIELRGPSIWEIGGDGAQGGVGREKMKSLVVQQNGITIRGQDYDDGTGMVQQEIFFNNGGTTALFYLEASNLTIENLHISGTWPTNSGGYALAIGRYTMIGPDPNATGLTVTGNTFNNLRAMFDTSSPAGCPSCSAPVPLTDGTVVDNTVTDTCYNIFKKYGVTFTGDNTITGNTFNHVGEGQSYPALQVLGHTGTTCIDYNTFNGWRSAEYAIGVQSALASPIGIGENNVFVDQVGGSGAGYELYSLASGGHAVGATSESDITACAVADNEGPITTAVEASPNPVKVGGPVELTANVDDSTTGGSNIASADYSLDGGPWAAMAAQDGSFDAVSEDVEATFDAPTIAGIYDLCVRGTDEHANTGDSECIMLVVYDPEGGFVTGGGWIDSPPGAYPATAWEQGFEVDTDGWFDNPGPVTRVSSGTNGITSASGDWHAEIGTDYTRWGGYSSSFPLGGYLTSLDIYLDLNAEFANDSRFDFSSAISAPDGNHRRDFIFNGGFYNDDTGPGAGQNRFVFSASNNAPGWPKNPERDPIAITSSGWYTLQHWFHDEGSGVLAVDMSILDSAGNLVHTWTLSDPTDVIGTTVGGNRYGWFATSQFPFLAIDNTYRAETPTGKATFGFVSKYNKKTELAEGNTEFVFKAADLNFHSTEYDWLVVTGSGYAKFKGTGTINGAGSYKFMLWAGDGDPDTFRIKIWEEDGSGSETVVYDNGMDQAIGGGQIAVHKK